ncbi:hypothetical protein acdb102_20350 [Acidothermaceae bacterium B102]|nr:hypothetical protein acdb102_20350 [Acidothermaceae bacterium B102]
MNTGRRVRQETGWRSLSCATCGPDTTHALIRSGHRRFRWFGPPAGEIREYARCLSCGTIRGQEEQRRPLTWAESLTMPADRIGADPR